MRFAKLNLKIDTVPGFFFIVYVMKSIELLEINIDCCRWRALLLARTTERRNVCFCQTFNFGA